MDPKYIHGFSGHFSNLDQDRIMDEFELGWRVANALEDEALGFGPLFSLQAEIYFGGQDG